MSGSNSSGATVTGQDCTVREAGMDSESTEKHQRQPGHLRNVVITHRTAVGAHKLIKVRQSG